MKKVIASAILLATFGLNANAQSTATSTASVEITTPIEITGAADMNFGKIAVQPATGGTIVMSADGTATPTSGVKLVAGGATRSAAAFTVTGTDGLLFNISLPADGVVSLAKSGGGAVAIPATTFTSSIGSSGTLTSGTASFGVGATLTIPAGQAAGSYESASFNVTVVYQ